MQRAALFAVVSVVSAVAIGAVAACAGRNPAAVGDATVAEGEASEGEGEASEGEGDAGEGEGEGEGEGDAGEGEGDAGEGEGDAGEGEGDAGEGEGDAGEGEGDAGEGEGEAGEGEGDGGEGEGGEGEGEGEGEGDPCDALEPNDTLETRVPAPASPTDVAVCGVDEDWYAIAVPPAALVDVSVTIAAGDLDLTLHDDTGACLASRDGAPCDGSGPRFYENSTEAFGVLAPVVARIIGHAGATGDYTFVTRALPWADGPDCAAVFDTATCEGRPAGVVDLLPFPLPLDDEPYALLSPSNYRYARRELIMLVRDALAEVSLDGRPVAIADLSQRDGLDPGTDFGAPRHPASAHEQGQAVDIAYFNTLGEDIHALRVICDAAGGSNDGTDCNAGAAHVVDIQEEVRFLARLYAYARTRVVFVDAELLADLRAEADVQLGAAEMTQSQRDGFDDKLTSGPFQHHHAHIALQWWE